MGLRALASEINVDIVKNNKYSFSEAVMRKFGSTVPNCVWFHEKLRPADVKLYKVLTDYAEETTKKYGNKYMLDNFYPGVLKSQKTIAERAGCTPKSVRSGLARLAEVGLIKVVERDVKETNIIHLIGELFGIRSENHGLTDEEKSEIEDIRDLRLRKECGFVGDLELFREWRKVGGLTKNEEEVVELAEHYASIARKRTGKTGYRAISKKKPSEHRNFAKFEELRDMAQDRGWDAKHYLEFIFAWTAAHWGKDPKTGKARMPYPKQILSEKLVKYYDRELMRQDERYHLSETKQKLNTPTTRSYSEEIELEVKHSANSLNYYVKRYKEQLRVGVIPERNKISLEAFKAIYIYQNWIALSPEYLYSVDWFRDDYFATLQENDPSDPAIMKIANTFSALNKSKRFREVALTAAIRYEGSTNLPRNLTLEELNA